MVESNASRPVLVLGGTGFLGTALSRTLAAAGHPVRVFGRNSPTSPVEPGVDYVAGDMADTDAVLAAVSDAHTAVHLVHTTLPASSMAAPSYDIESNVAASARWLARLGETNVRRLVFVSSGGTVYGLPKSLPIDEAHPTDPICSYGITKLAIEKYVAMFANLAGIGYRIVRPSNVYGPGQRLDTGQGSVGILAARALMGETLEIWGDGRHVRDFVFVDDAISALVRILTYEGSQVVFNLSSGTGHSMLDVVSSIGRVLGRPAGVRFTGHRPIDVPISILDSARLREATGWQPHVPFDAGVERTVTWLRTLPGALEPALHSVFATNAAPDRFRPPGPDARNTRPRSPRRDGRS